MPSLLLIVYCLLIVSASLLGGWLPFFVQLTHRRMQLLMSFVGGLMLGVALLHLIPHALHEAESVEHAADHVAYAVVAGVLLTFFMIRFFHVHQHGHEVGDGHEHHEDTCDHGPHEHAHGSDHTHTHHLSWSGLFFGLALHTFFDGLALGASVTAGSHDGEGAVGLLGVGTFLAIVLHKPLDSLSLTCVMSGGRWTRKSIGLMNLAFASMCPLGAVIFYLGLGGWTSSHPVILAWALGFAGGIFLCISLADILPELQFHQHDRGLLSVSLLLGVSLAYLIGFAESGHGHSETHHHAKTEQSPDHSDHGHSDHDHGIREQTESEQSHDNHDHGDSHSP